MAPAGFSASVPPRNLVTGVTGFAGCFLAQALVERGQRVVGISRRAAWPDAWHHLAEKVELLQGDLCDGGAVESLLRRFQPGRIYHLAGYARVSSSFREPEAAWDGNLTATRRLCEALIRWGGPARLLHVGSGLVYGPASDPDRPVTEESPLRPDTPYAASKAAADLACFQYTCAPGLDIVRARPFNHIGPHQSAEFAVPNFARQIVAIERGERPAVIDTGNLDSLRDLTDVRDVVDAYLLLMEHGSKGEAYNIGAGRSLLMRTVLDKLLELAGVKVELRRDEKLLRPTEPGTIRVDAGKLRRETGWAPRYSLEETLWDILEAWRRS
jgi:GDP-4-dehydro-6-deoxy-D-mannose reductase